MISPRGKCLGQAGSSNGCVFQVSNPSLPSIHVAQSATDFLAIYTSSGLSLALSSPILDAMRSASQIGEAIVNTGDARLQALGAASVALQSF